MKPGLRKLVLTTHITLSVGWLGAVITYLALAIVGLTSHDAQRVQAAYLSMETIAWFVIIPFSLTTWLAGLAESLGTPWGLFRYWWVFVKFVLTTGATIILLRHLPVVTEMANTARAMTWSAAGFLELRIQLAVHAAGGLLVLLGATVLSVYKPWGMTPYGRRVAREQRPASPVGVPSPEPVVLQGTTPRTPRWAYIVGFHAIGLALLFVVLHLTEGRVWSH